MKSIAIASGKGGVGKTSFAANLGICLVELGNRVTIFDADLALANLDVILGTQPEFTLQHVLSGQKTIAEALTMAPGGVATISGGSAVYGLMHSGPKRLGMFLAQIDELAKSNEYLIFDAAAGLDNKVMTFLRAADETLLVTTPDPAAVADAYATIKVLFRKKPDAEVSLVVNMASSEKEGREIHRKLNEVSQTFLERGIELAGTVRYDDQARKSARTRIPYAIGSRDCLAAQDTAAVAKWLQAKRASGTGAGNLRSLEGELESVAIAS